MLLCVCGAGLPGHCVVVYVCSQGGDLNKARKIKAMVNTGGLFLAILSILEQLVFSDGIYNNGMNPSRSELGSSAKFFGLARLNNLCPVR